MKEEILPAYIIDFFEKLEEEKRQKQENRIYAEISFYNDIPKTEEKDEDSNIFIPLR